MDIQIIIFLSFILFLLLKRLRLKKLKSYLSPLGKIEVLEKYNQELVLTINTYPQGVSIQDPSIKDSYWYKIALETVKFCQQTAHPKVIARVLMLGLGANTIPNLIAKLDPRIHQTVVEIDKYIIQACRDYFNLDKLPNYRLIQEDAYKYLKTQNSKLKTKYDVIIVDIFLGRPPYIDLKSNQPNFIQNLLPFLKSGVLIFNRPAHTETSKSESRQLKEYLETKFKSVEVFFIKDPRGYKNHVITASIRTPGR